MNARPGICPACGELVIALILDPGAQVLPTHPDRIEPSQDCVASACVLRDGRILQF